MVAKISPTSPRGIIPIPMSHLSPGDPNTPTAATSLPTMAMASSAAAIPSTSGLKNFSTWASMPMPRKNTGMKRCPTGASSRSMRSFAELRDSATPATNAPTIGASFAASASSANARVNASARATSVPADLA